MKGTIRKEILESCTGIQISKNTRQNDETKKKKREKKPSLEVSGSGRMSYDGMQIKRQFIFRIMKTIYRMNIEDC